jgi:hypothetical protein
MHEEETTGTPGTANDYVYVAPRPLALIQVWGARVVLAFLVITAPLLVLAEASRTDDVVTTVVTSVLFMMGLILLNVGFLRLVTRIARFGMRVDADKLVGIHLTTTVEVPRHRVEGFHTAKGLAGNLRLFVDGPDGPQLLYGTSRV